MAFLHRRRGEVGVIKPLPEILVSPSLLYARPPHSEMKFCLTCIQSGEELEQIEEERLSKGRIPSMCFGKGITNDSSELLDDTVVWGLLKLI